MDLRRFLTSSNLAAMHAIALAAQRQVANFIATGGATTIDSGDSGLLFQTPIPLPKTLDFIP